MDGRVHRAGPIVDISICSSLRRRLGATAQQQWRGCQERGAEGYNKETKASFHLLPRLAL